MLIIRRTALHVSWTTRHPSRPTGKSWNVVPAAENTSRGEPLKDTLLPQLCICSSPRRPLAGLEKHHSVHVQNSAKEGTASDIHAARPQRWQQRSACHGHLPSASQGRPRGVYVVKGVLDEVLQEVPRPTAPTSEENVPLRNQITWT